MRHLIDYLRDKTTMYRLVLIYLAAVVVLAAALGAAGFMVVSPVAVVTTTALLLVVCWTANWLLARLFRMTPNKESALITALIMALISGPVSIVAEPVRAGMLALAGVIAIASKFLIAPRRQHIFNPAAIGVFAVGLLFGQYATWWVGNIALLPLVALGGLLVVSKTSRFAMVGLFLLASVVFIPAYSLFQGLDPRTALRSLGYVLLHTEIIFFAVVMLTEPLTSPKTAALRAAYAVLVAFFFLPQLTLFGVSFSPSAALLIGNLFSYLVSPGTRLVLALKEKKRIGANIMSFSFEAPEGFRHRVGQYMEWTLSLDRSDSRGNRRYFTIASSPTEKEVLIAARFCDRPSAYKKALSAMRCGDPVVAAELSGDFVLPRDPAVPLVFIAGGIGITPFRSMIKYLVDRREKRSIVLIYSNYCREEIVFADVFEEAEREIGLRIVHTLTDPERVPAGWNGGIGLVDAKKIAAEVPDYRSRTFYISGSLGMVGQIKKQLKALGVRNGRVRTDFFPGYSL